MAVLHFTDALNDGNWNSVQVNGSNNVTASNWTGNVVPGAGDDLIIETAGVFLNGLDHFNATDAGDSLAITQAGSLLINASLFLGNGANNGGETLQNLGSLTVGNEGRLRVAGGTIDNQGIFTLKAGSTGSAMAQLIISGDVTLQGGGVLDGLGTVLLDTSAGAGNIVTGSSSATAATLHIVDTTLHGGGTISDVGGLLVLDILPGEVVPGGFRPGGFVLADSATVPLTISLSAPVTVGHALGAIDAGTLVLNSASNVIPGGQIEAVSAESVVIINGAVVNDGFITSSNGIVTINAVVTGTGTGLAINGGRLVLHQNFQGHLLEIIGVGGGSIELGAGIAVAAPVLFQDHNGILKIDGALTGILSTSGYDAAVGDKFDLSAILSAAFNHGSGQPAESLFRAVENTTGTGALLQIDSDGNANGNHWSTIATLTGVHQGEFVKTILDSSSPGGVSLGALTDAGALGDFNGDGTSDALWRNDDGSTAIWQMNNGNVASTLFPAGVPNDWHIVGIGDFNGDLTSDVLWRNDDGTVLEWLMSNNAIQSVQAVAVQDASTWTVAGTGDFNHDTNSDFLWRVDNGNGSYDIVVWEMNGSVIGTTGTAGTLDNAWGIVGIGDFNGDGKADVLFRNGNDATTAIWNMNGTALSGAAFEPGVPTDWHVVGTGDFNGDHTTDILWKNDGGVLAIWQMANDQPASEGFFGVGADWHVVGIGDVNHDGKDDIVWRNDNGSTAISLMNGTSVGGTSFPGGVSADWEPTTHHYDFV